MTQESARIYGRVNGFSAALHCEVSDSDRREAACNSACSCNQSQICAECVTRAAYEAEQNARDFTPFEFFASECNKSKRSDALWSAYEKGVARGIRRGVDQRLKLRERQQVLLNKAGKAAYVISKDFPE